MSGVLQAVVASIGGAVTGQQAYITPGTYSWVAPAGVTSVSVVCVGAGTYYGGGALGYKNNITVVPGNSYTVRVGAVTANPPDSTGESYFINTSTVKGGNSTSFSVRSTYTGDGGGQGGLAPGSGNVGGGAGGYSGTGGDGTNTGSFSNGTAGAGGAGGGGGWTFYPSRGGGGGGVGLLGQGASGAGGVATNTSPTPPPNGTALGGGGGSGGADGGAASWYSYICCGSTVYSGIQGTGGNYGGGGNSVSAGVGAVRIIWPGTTRSFPSTNTGDL